jgi:hypothetical protein
MVAQTIPEFQYTLYIQDARGNKDSIILGYDRTETRRTLNAEYGEVDIKNRPFDSVLEVRATEARNRFDIKFHSKKIITFFEGICPLNAVSSNITLLIRAKYLPIKFSWNKNLFTDNCRSRSILVCSENYYSVEPPFNGREADSLFGTAYLRDQVEKLEKFDKRTPSGYPNPYFHYTFTAPTNAGRNDTIWTYATSFHAGPIVKTHNIDIQELKSYPNPCTDILNLQLEQQESGVVEVYDLTGIKVYSKTILMSNQIALDLRELSKGLYFLHFWTGNQKRYAAKFIKM